MTEYVFPPAPQATIAVEGGSARFPVRRIFCVGRNYAAHTREMGRDPEREKPFFFTKPADAVVDDGATVPYPLLTENLHYEIELVVAIGKKGVNVAPERTQELIYGYSVGIDLTRRDLQFEARDNGRPWDWGKAFDKSAPIAPIKPVAKSGHPASARIWLAVNDQIKQDANISDLIWSVPDLVATISRSMVLKPGDLIMTGTPAGVSAIKPGDVVTGGIDGVGKIRITIGERAVG
jgi:fumarylpyruvate hydrolase